MPTEVKPFRNGAERSFNAWVRSLPEIETYTLDLAVTDCDFVFHKTRLRLEKTVRPGRDPLGDKVSLLMFVELKTYGGVVDDSQNETLFFVHQLLERRRPLHSSWQKRPKSVWSMGVSVLYLSDESLDVGTIEWGRFNQSGYIERRFIDIETLRRLLIFDIDPDDFVEFDFERHHGETTTITYNAAIGPLFAGMGTRQKITRKW